MVELLNWKVSRDDIELIFQIADRAIGIAMEARVTGGRKVSVFKRELVMDLTATHANGCPLRLANLVAAPAADFAHDVFGIRGHLDRDTGQLKDCFVPRYAARVS